MPSVEDIFIVKGVAVGSDVNVGSGVDVIEICVGTGVSDGMAVLIMGTVVTVAPWQATRMKMESERIVFFIIEPVESLFALDLQKIWD